MADTDSFTSEELNNTEVPVRCSINSYPIITSNGGSIDIVEDDERTFYLVQGPMGPPGKTIILNKHPTMVFVDKNYSITPDIDYVIIKSKSSNTLILPASTTKEQEFNKKFTGNCIHIRCVDSHVHTIQCQKGETFYENDKNEINVSKFTSRTLFSINNVWYYV